VFDIDEEASEPNRWPQLISITGVAMTLSSIGGELTGYFQFLSTVNHTFDGAINKIIGIAIGGESYGSTTLCVVKAVLTTICVWALFFIALRRYAVTYENTTLDEWISEVRCFLTVKPENKWQEIALTECILFALLPPASLWSTVTPRWHATKLFAIRGIQIRLWNYLTEAAFLHGVVLFGVLALSFLLRIPIMSA